MTRWTGRTTNLPCYPTRQRSNSSAARLASAHHEAGHATAVLYFKRPLHRIAVYEHGGGVTMQNAAVTEPLCDETVRNFLDRLKRNGARLSDQWVKDDLALTYAGPVAGTRAGGSSLGGSDRDSIHRMIVALARDEDEACRAFDEARARAESLVVEFWDVIRDIAVRLDAARELSGEACREICRRSVLGRRLLGEEEPMKYVGMGALTAQGTVRQLTEPRISYRSMTAQLERRRPEDIARQRRETLEQMCDRDGYDPTMHLNWWIHHIMLAPDPPYRGGKIYGLR